MKQNRAIRAFVLVLVSAVLTIGASGAGRVLATNAAAEPVTLFLASPNVALTLDPQLAEDYDSVMAIENLFVGLTDFDPKTSQIRPEAATEWKHNDAGTVWTFQLRGDIPWVRWDPATKKAIEVRTVTAADFVYGIKRSCDPRLDAYYTKIAASIVKGCDVVAGLKTEAVKDSDFDQIGVKALSDTQFEITTQANLSFFLYTTSMWMFHAVPEEAIAEFGDNWTQAGKIITNGSFVADVYFPGTKAVYLRNPLYPKAVNDSYGGNVERVNQIVVGTDTQYELFQDNQTDYSDMPYYLYTRIKKDPVVSKQIIQRAGMAVEFIGFMYDKPPFDKVQVRRAFSAALDRKAFTDQFQGVPIAHLMPPGIFGAVELNEVGLGDSSNPGFDADYAKKQLAEAGYPDCKGFPQVNFLTTSNDVGLFVREAIKDNLGCAPGLLNIRHTDWESLVFSIKASAPDSVRPHLYLVGWQADYPDAQNWMHDLLGCGTQNDLKRPCNSAIDGKIDAAAIEPDKQKRLQLYRDLETALFGKDGEFPIAPLDIFGQEALAKPWLTAFFETDANFGGAHWDSYRIDQAAQLAARTGKAAKP